MSGRIAIASEKVRKKEEERRKKKEERRKKKEERRKKKEERRKGKILLMVDISTTFTQTIPTDMIS